MKMGHFEWGLKFIVLICNGRTGGKANAFNIERSMAFNYSGSKTSLYCRTSMPKDEFLETVANSAGDNGINFSLSSSQCSEKLIRSSKWKKQLIVEETRDRLLLRKLKQLIQENKRIKIRFSFHTQLKTVDIS